MNVITSAAARNGRCRFACRRALRTALRRFAELLPRGAAASARVGAG